MSNIGHNSKQDVNTLVIEKRDFIKKTISEISDSMTRVESERDFVKESVDKAMDFTGVEKKIIRKLAKVYHASSFDEDKETQQVFESDSLMHKQFRCQDEITLICNFLFSPIL